MAQISTTVIANMALSLLGVSPVLSTADDQKRAKVLDLWYEPTRDWLLRKHEWTFAMARAELARLAEEPAFGWLYQYQLPVKPKTLRVTELVEVNQYNFQGNFIGPNSYGSQREEISASYEIEGDKLLTNQETASIKYVRKITDPTIFDSMFVMTLAHALAYVSCFDITGSIEKRGQLWNAFQAQANEAMGQSSKERFRTPDHNRSWITAGRVGLNDLFLIGDLRRYG